MWAVFVSVSTDGLQKIWSLLFGTKLMVGRATIVVDPVSRARQRMSSVLSIVIVRNLNITPK